MSLKNNNKGFTLIEMVIVIVIIAVLAAMLVPSLLAYVNNAYDKKLITAGDTLNKACVTEIAQLVAEGEDFDAKSNDPVFDDEFWENLGKHVDDTVAEFSSGEDAKYLVYFEVRDNVIFDIKVSDGDRTVQLVDGSWKRVD